eukprot:gene25773-34354_t
MDQSLQPSAEVGSAHLPKKRTIVKDRVGCVRTSTYDLPQEGFVFGMKSPDGNEGAGDIISNWVTANPSIEKQSSKMVVAQNILAIRKGCITAKSMRQYGIDHPNVRLKEVLSQDSTRGEARASHEGPFGRKTEFAEESFGSIIQAKFTNFSNSDADYPTITSIKKTGEMPNPRTTRAAQSILKAREDAIAQEIPKKFCMKRFQNIPGKMNLNASLKNGGDSGGYSSSDGEA